MYYRRLGQSGIEVSVIGIGAWAIGGSVRTWGPVDDNESIAAIRQGLDLGINLIETAPAYGYGHSEEIVGRALSGRRGQALLATQCGLVWREPGGRLERKLIPESIRRECEASLRRLRVESIDLYQVQGAEAGADLGAVMETLLGLREQGRIRIIGVSNFSCEQLGQARRCGPVDAVQGEFSLLERGATDALLPYCGEYGIAFLAYAPLARGLLTGKFSESSRFSDLRANDPCFAGEAFRRNLALVERLGGIAGRVGCGVGELALCWAVQQPGVTCAIAGAKLASQVRENAAAGEMSLSPQVMDEIEILLAERDRE